MSNTAKPSQEQPLLWKPAPAPGEVYDALDLLEKYFRPRVMQAPQAIDLVLQLRRMVTETSTARREPGEPGAGSPQDRSDASRGTRPA